MTAMASRRPGRVRPLRLGQEAFGRLGRHAQRAADLGRGLAGLEADDDAVGVAQPAGHDVEQAGEPLAVGPEVEVGAQGGGAVAGTSASASVPGLALGRTARPGRRRPRPRPGPGLEGQGELLELALEALLALAHVAHEGLGRAGRELEVELAGAGGDPLRELPGLDRRLSAHVASDRLDGLDERRRDLDRPSSPREEGDREVVAVAGQQRATASASSSFQRSTPSTMTKRRPRARVMAESTSTTRSALAVLASRISSPWAPLSRSPARAGRPGARQPPVVVAVDEVGALEAGTRPSLCRR